MQSHSTVMERTVGTNHIVEHEAVACMIMLRRLANLCAVFALVRPFLAAKPAQDRPASWKLRNSAWSPQPELSALPRAMVCLIHCHPYLHLPNREQVAEELEGTWPILRFASSARGSVERPCRSPSSSYASSSTSSSSSSDGENMQQEAQTRRCEGQNSRQMLEAAALPAPQAGSWVGAGQKGRRLTRHVRKEMPQLLWKFTWSGVAMDRDDSKPPSNCSGHLKSLHWSLPACLARKDGLVVGVPRRPGTSMHSAVSSLCYAVLSAEELLLDCLQSLRKYISGLKGNSVRALKAGNWAARGRAL